MLDDLKYIHEKDVQDALGIAEKQWEQLLHEYDISKWPQAPKRLTNIVYAGMGGSSLAALVSKTWPGHTVPFEICRQYNVPKYVGSETLFIACSYSGNTEETIESIKQAGERGATVIIIAGGGKLADIAREHNYPLLILPKAVQPRFAILYNLKALVDIVAWAGLNDSTQVTDWRKTSEFLKASVASWLPTVATKDNPAKQLALELMGKSPVVYGGPLMAPAAYKWRIGFNENAKNVAWWNEIPEFNHNEMIGWSSHPTAKPYEIINLVSQFEHPRILKRMEVAERLLSGLRPAAHNIESKGDNIFEHLLWSINFGDFVSLYLGLLNGVNPSPVELVEKFKVALND